MKKNKYIIITLGLLFAMLFNTCKKYPEGGLVYSRIKNLFGKSKGLSKKSWKLNLYEVNNIDSTNLIQGSVLSPSSNGDFIIFENDKDNSQYSWTAVYFYSTGVDKEAKLLSFGSLLSANNNDTSQCFLKNNVSVCQRNIFNPERNKWLEWDIRKLTETELIITKQLINNYKIILTH